MICMFKTGFSHGIEVHTSIGGQAWYGASTTLSCSYTPTSSRNDFTQLKWAKDGQDILAIWDSSEDLLKREGRYNLSVDFTSSGNLTFNEVEIDDEGTYMCQVKIRRYVLKSSSVDLEVLAAPSELILRGQAGETPVIIHQGTVTLKPSLDVEFMCEAIGSRPSVTIAWYIDDALEETDLGTSTTNSNDARLRDTTSSLVIANPGRLHHGILLTCQALIEGRLVRNTSIVINVEEPPNQPINILGLYDHVSSSEPQRPYCIASSSFPVSFITWSLDEENVTDNAEVTTTVMTSGMMRVISVLDYDPMMEDDGKVLRCRVGHVALAEDIIAEKAICLTDSMLAVSVKRELSTSLILDLSGIQHSSLCSLSTCDTTEGGECTSQYIGTKYSDVVDHVHEVRNLLASTTYEVDLRCHHRLCRESTASTRASVPSPTVLINDQGSNLQTTSDEKLWIRDLIFVIIAVIVVSAFVIVVTVSVVLRAVVKVAGAQEENNVTISPDRIQEANGGKTEIYHEIKELRSSLVQPSDIIVSTQSSSPDQQHSLGQSTRLVMRHPRPPPLPLPTHSMSVTSAVMTASDATDTESEKEGYMPLLPYTYSKYTTMNSADSKYMTMKSADSEYMTMKSADSKYMTMNSADSKYMTMNSADSEYMTMNSVNTK
ncbi:uncharacterized protein LOC105445449 [Strongylocentrotus purpuratus]|uniref:Ig-like domain-containing protein n=1 Tax=Strongylocentrotus purpuratus TaxID=7668 RepID=A0A7M7NEX0_STRPU|nr:uncharacterized protein LOC105445449 [Strongylocentrotus purpuratus]